MIGLRKNQSTLSPFSFLNDHFLLREKNKNAQKRRRSELNFKKIHLCMNHLLTFIENSRLASYVRGNLSKKIFLLMVYDEQKVISKTKKEKK